MKAHPFAPGAIERHRRARRYLTRLPGLPGSPDQRRALLRALRTLVLFLTVVALSAFAAGLIAGATAP
jgi:hypothetical protein